MRTRTIEENVKRLNEIESLMKENKILAEDTCIEDGYPGRGSNYELRVEFYNRELQEEMDMILEDDFYYYLDGIWVEKSSVAN